MWIPESAEEIERTAEDGRLEELPAVEAKRELPRKGKSEDIAVDVAAMTTAGGTLVYGIAEDAQKRPRIPRPIELKDTAERIDQISQTAISEPPYIETREFPLESDPGHGYLAVVVPKSPRAPHQVTVKGDLRYYGRGAKGNRILTEGEVARLYRERELQEADADRLLSEAVAVAPFGADPDLGYLHAFTRPAALLDDAAWNRVTADGDAPLLTAMTEAAQAGSYTPYDPALYSLSSWRRRGADVWTLEAHDDGKARRALRCDVNADGRGYLFCGRAADRSNEHLYIIEQLIAGNLCSFLGILGAVYERASYHGAVDLGVAVTGIEGGTSYLAVQRNAFVTHTYGAEGAYRTLRVLAGELAQPQEVARRLLQRLLDATVQPGVDVFEVAS